MKSKILSFLSLLIMMVVSTSAWAATTPIDKNYTFICQEAMNGDAVNSSSNLGDYIKCVSSNNYSYATNKGSSTINGASYYNAMQIKGGRGLVFSVKKPCTLTIYGQVNGDRVFTLGTTENGKEVATCSNEGGVYEITLTDSYVEKDLYLNASSDLFLAGLVFSGFATTNVAPTISLPLNVSGDTKHAIKINATVAGTPTPSLKWYSNTTASNEGGTEISGATASTYQFSPTTPGNYYFYAIASNTLGNATSGVTTVTVSQAYAISYSKDADVIGTVPATVQTTGNFTTPINKSLYKPGYTLASWGGLEPGSNTVASQDFDLKATFTQNTKSLADVTEATTVRFINSNSQEATYQSSNQNAFVEQVVVDGEKIDAAIVIAGGKFAMQPTQNNGKGRAQTNNGTKVTIPVTKNAKVEIEIYDNNSTPTFNCTIDGKPVTDYIPSAATGKVRTMTYIYEGDASTIDYVVNASNMYAYQINVTYPVQEKTDPEPTGWKSYELVLNKEGLLTADEISSKEKVTFGIALDAEGKATRVAAESEEAIAVVTGNYHSDHGMNPFSMTAKVPGAVKITAGTCSFGTCTVTVNGNAVGESVVGDNETKCWKNSAANVATGIYQGEAGEITITTGCYTPYIKIEKYEAPEPGPEPTGWVDFEIDMRGNKFLTEASAPSTVGFKKSGSTIVACDVDDAESLGTITGRSRNDDHGLVSFSMTVAVPGYVKIEAGTCAWGGNLTISGANGFSTTVNTNNGNCFHGNTTANRVVAYYSMDEATTLTIAGGNYMPFIKITKVEAVPQQFTVTFKNGSDVTTKKIYEGTALGTLPNVEASGSKYFLGWYSDVNKVDTRAAASTVPTADVTYTAIVKDININEDGYYQPEAGDAFSFLAHLEKANATATADSPAKIFIPNGTYDLGTLINTEVKNNVHIFGESRDGVTIVNHPAQAGMSSSETLNVRGSNVYMQNFTVRCDVSYTGSVANGVGTAIRTYGDKNIFYNLNLQGNQDTFNTPMGESARAYVKNGRIEGTVDYICGSGNIWFESVNLYMNQRSSADVIAAPSTAAKTEYGYVFNSCTIDGDAATQAGKYNLSRGWKDSPAATWINTNCIIKPSDKGYTNMTKDLVCRFHEYNTMYNGEAVTGHNLSELGYSASSDDIYLSAIGNYTYEKVVMASDGWDPEAIIAAYNPIDVTVGETGWATFSAQYDAVIPTGMTAYYVSATDQNTVTLKKIEDEAVAKNTGLIIAAAQGSYTFVPASSQTYTELGDMNKLKATSTGAYTCENAGDIFVLTKTGENTVGMRKASAGLTLAENKAYLPAQPNQAKSLQFIFEDDATAIMMESSDTKKFDGPIYDAAGRQTNSIMRGINIMNGIKVAK